MLKELAAYWQGLWDKSREAKPLNVNDPRKRYFVLNGEVFAYDVAPPLRKMKAVELVDFADCLLRYRESETRWAVWHDEDRLCGVFNDETLREFVVLDLPDDDSWEAFESMEWTLALSPAELQRESRGTLNSVLEPSLVAALAKIEATAGTVTTAESGHARDRGTREYQTEIRSEADIPQRTTLRLLRWTLEGCPWCSVRASVEVDPRSLAITLEPLPGEIEKAVRYSRQWLRTRLCELLRIPEENRNAAPIFWGAVKLTD